MTTLQLLLIAKWKSRPDYVEVRVTKDIIGFHYRRAWKTPWAGRHGPHLVLEPMFVCYLRAAADFWRRVSKKRFLVPL